jgi:hypothetical protein
MTNNNYTKHRTENYLRNKRYLREIKKCDRPQIKLIALIKI